MSRTRLSADNAAIVLIDHQVGMANFLRSHTLEEHLNNTVALAKVAKIFDTPLVVTAGPLDGPGGPLYPELAHVLGDHPVGERVPAMYDGFDDAAFTAAIEATGRKKLILAGVQTDVCLSLTALTAIDRGYEVYLVGDASAAGTKETHELAMDRMTQAGAVPVGWLAVGSEFQRGWAEDSKTAAAFAEVIYEHIPAWKQQAALTAGVREHAAK
ncbi:isochorismatase family protein [Streptomyces iconiensis]|uniref:Isochorismatase family protein n=1 Tax=Streptomyces iconiensis TaxID=1384038 RepID=A0ABT7A105_9ACTN|nr:isochorismatase family protein [Streptomyces iconiensis]MDJ1135018.1 isochorismatase family protein [Streptomyces iconiensis]